ncbi:McrC family protein [Geofilum rubicundum]|uniref:McrBC 5-methylcytosine restriction system component n=1 Tax=Geofilum rubicundum JCM 15548 TaxID=1236989 RepID=A0A0E9M3H0_9BACT|nr:McrC family protein [Geofilum rubicundum]GAO31720.1 McrBC 5-methylcytosine restriction system component [Geofilum rubicundum JCM 15548]
MPYFKLIRQGVQFNEYVGAIQVGDTLVEVLPKADKSKANGSAKNTWRDVLINMLRTVQGFDVKAPSASQLKVRENSVLDLYFEMFIKEVEYLLHQGLSKRYHQIEGNVLTLKGSLKFDKHLNKNIIHKERFFTNYTVYDTNHILHVIIYQTLLLLKRINTNPLLTGRINSLLLNFPELPERKTTESLFNKIVFNRKTQGYKTAIEIARLILLQYHPDLSKGKNDVLALMFDMNMLWEQFVLVTLKKEKSLRVKGQNSRFFWKPIGGHSRTIRPDITIFKNGKNYVLDTKWKMVDRKPSIEDIRQMYAYHQYFDAAKVALLFPGTAGYISGKFFETNQHRNLSDKECGLLFTQFNESVKNWQKQIVCEVSGWIGV